MPPRHDSLTPADCDLLERLARGEQGKKIASELGIGVTGVARRVERIVKILGAENRTNAVAVYLAPERFRKSS